MNNKIGPQRNPQMGQRIRAFRGNLNQKQFADIVGISQGNVSKMEKGMVPDPNILLRISKLGNTSVEFLLTGKKPERLSVVSFGNKQLPEGISLISKLKGPGSAGTGIEPDDEVDIQLAFRDDWLEKFGGPEKLVALVIEGDSMEPTLFDKDVVVVNKNITAIRSGGGIYSLVWDNKRMVKRLQLNPQTHRVRVKSDSPRYDDFEVDPETIKIEGKLIWFGRELK